MTARDTTNDSGHPMGPDVSRRDVAMEHIAAALHGLQFGVISVVVQDGVVIQIERTERTRLRSKNQG